MKTAATARLSLALGLPRSAALGVARLRVLRRRALIQAGHEAGRGNLAAAALLLVLYLAGR